MIDLHEGVAGVFFAIMCKMCAKVRMCKFLHIRTHAKCVPGASRSLFAIMSKNVLYDKFFIFASLCFDRFDEFFPHLFLMLIVEIHF